MGVISKVKEKVCSILSDTTHAVRSKQIISDGTDLLKGHSVADSYKIVYGIHEKSAGCKRLISPSVETFLACFANAEYVITDSFHGTALATNLGRKFASFIPSRFGIRLIDYLHMTNCDNHIVSDSTNLQVPDCNIDFDFIRQTILTMRNCTEDKLYHAILRINRTFDYI